MSQIKKLIFIKNKQTKKRRKTMWETNEIVEPTVTINGEVIVLTSGEPFRDTIIQIANVEGYSKVRVFMVVNGVEEEVTPDNAPQIIENGMEIIIRPYEKASLSA